MIKDLYPLKLYLKTKTNLFFLALSLSVNIIIWIWLFWQIKPQQDYIFLHYNILFGVDYVGEWWKIIYIPLTGLLIFVTNTLLSWVLYGRDRFASIVLNATCLFCQLFLLIAASLLVFLNV